MVYSLIAAIAPNIIAGVLMLIVGVIVHGMLSSRRLPTVIALGPIVYGAVRLIVAMLQYFTLTAMISRNTYLASITSTASIILGLAGIVLLAIFIVYGVHVLVSEITMRKI